MHEKRGCAYFEGTEKVLLGALFNNYGLHIVNKLFGYVQVFLESVISGVISGVGSPDHFLRLVGSVLSVATLSESGRAERS